MGEGSDAVRQRGRERVGGVGENGEGAAFTGTLDLSPRRHAVLNGGLV